MHSKKTQLTDFLRLRVHIFAWPFLPDQIYPTLPTAGSFSDAQRRLTSPVEFCTRAGIKTALYRLDGGGTASAHNGAKIQGCRRMHTRSTRDQAMTKVAAHFLLLFSTLGLTLCLAPFGSHFHEILVSPTDLKRRLTDFVRHRVARIRNVGEFLYPVFSSASRTLT